LLLIGLGVPLALLPANAGFGLAVLATAVALATGGLVSSVFHLGRPERAWRAFSRWRSSWLSREGVMSVATFVPAAVFAIGWIFFRRHVGNHRVVRHPRRGARRRHDLLHRHDLRVLAEPARERLVSANQG
jgi:DMSO reductase anchor subunit